jgi:hypothetical protein
VTLAPKRRQQRSGVGGGVGGGGGDGGRKKISISISIAAKLDHLRRRNTCAFRLPAAMGLHIHFAAVEKARRVHRVIDPLPPIRAGKWREEREGPLYRASSATLPGDSNRTRPDLRVASCSRCVKNERCPRPGGHFSLKSTRDRENNPPAWRENIFSRRAVGTPGFLVRENLFLSGSPAGGMFNLRCRVIRIRSVCHIL